MDFYQVVDQVIDLLRSRGRVTYGALKLQFNLGDNQLEVLKDELIYAQQLAVDEDNRVLVWTGGIEETAVSVPQPTQTTQQPIVQQDQPTKAEPPSPEPSTPDAERRQLTVMFCDLSDSTRLSGQLDPEDLRDVIRAYQSTSAEVIERYDGYIAQHLGDGLMVYFGWPQAHEDDAQRAVHAGLGILEAMQALNVRLEQEKEIRLAVRIGIHTGLVVVGEIGKGASQEHLALGETPNIASRIEGIAELDTVAISADTYHLVQGYFVCEDLGQPALKGVSDLQQVYRVVGISGAQSRLDVGATRGLTPLVGREQEVGLLLERWTQVKDGQGQVVLLSGEAGIGKSRLIQVLKDHVADEPHTRLECRSSPYYENTALYPITDMLQRLLQWQQDDTPEQRLATLEYELSQYRLVVEDAVPLFATLLSLPLPEDRYPTLALSPQRQRQKTLETIVGMLLERSEQQPVLFILEDLHWTDPSTLEVLDLLIEQTPTASILTLLTCRPTFQPRWGLRTHLTPIALNRLTRTQIEDMAERVAGGKRLPGDVLQQIVEKTDGVPLFVEEMTKAVLESGLLQEVHGQYEAVSSLSSLSIPATLQDSLMARLDHLVTAKAVAQYASVIGRQFSYTLLQAVSQLDEAMLQHELGRLVEAELVYQRGLALQATYTFKHALVQDAAYQSLLKSTRQQYHQRIAQVLQERFPEMAETQPELLAHHFTEAGLSDQGITYWQRAGQRAGERSANTEAITHLSRGLEMLQSLSDTPERAERELEFHMTLGPALIAIKGYGAPEVEHAYARARELCRQVGDTPQLFPVLSGLAIYYVAREELYTTLELVEQYLHLAQRQPDVVPFLRAHTMLGRTLLLLGEMTQAHTHLEQAMALYDPQQHRDLLLSGQNAGVTCLTYMAWTLWMFGYSDQALAKNDEILALARGLTHPFSLARAQASMAMWHQFRRQKQTVQAYAEALIALSTEHEFVQYLAAGMILRGWALAAQGQVAEGIDQIRRGMAGWRDTGAELFRPYWLALLVEAHTSMGQTEERLAMLTEALATAERTGERWWAAELHRLKGELLLSQSSEHRVEAEGCFHQALDIARSQQAKSLELRAATSLARLWQQQGKRQDAHDLLAPVYGWFTEGFDTADLQDAKALLDELARSGHAAQERVGLRLRGFSGQGPGDGPFEKGGGSEAAR
ncbi:MAG: AAA family ATPase [bacterium]|nr:AAA family ATPase [bacterium]